VRDAVGKAKKAAVRDAVGKAKKAAVRDAVDDAKWEDLRWRIGELRRTVIDAYGLILAMYREVKVKCDDDRSKRRRSMLYDRAHELGLQLHSAGRYIDANPSVLALIGMDRETVFDRIERVDKALGEAMMYIRRVRPDTVSMVREEFKSCLNTVDDVLDELDEAVGEAERHTDRKARR
jgi:hypothetical protein